MNKYSILIISVFSLFISYHTSIVIASGSSQTIFNDTDIDDAILQLENKNLSREELSTLISKAGTSELSTTASKLGFIYHISHNPDDTNPWQAMRYDLDNDSSITIYAGKSKIQSIAGSLNGNIIILNLQRQTTDNLEIYRLHINLKSVYKLTETTVNNINVSSSADGRHIAWQQEDNGFNTVYGRVYLDTKANALYQDFSLAHFKPQRDPSISSSGRHLVLIRDITNYSDWVYLYDLYTSEYQLVTKSSNNKAHPSVSADGQKITWLVIDESNNIAELKDLSLNSTTTVIDSSTSLNHPYITADGNWLGYSQKVNGVWQVRTKNLMTNVIVKASPVSLMNDTEAYWQRPSSQNLPSDIKIANNFGSSANIDSATADSITKIEELPTNLATFDSITIDHLDNSANIDSAAAGSTTKIEKLPTDMATFNSMTIDHLGNFKSIDSITTDSATTTELPPSDITNSDNLGPANIDSNTTTDSAIKTKKLPSDVIAFDRFGSSVSIDGNTMVVGVDHNLTKGADAGSAYVLEKVNNDWVFAATLIANGGTENDRFGVAVAVSGDTIVIGCPPDKTDDFNLSSAHIFERNAGGTDNWGEVQKLTPSDGTWGDQFGISVSVFNDTMVIGADLGDNDGSDTGKAYIFERNAGGANNWGETKKLLASDGIARDHFGKSVDIYNDLIVIGAPKANIAGVVDDGAVYIFERNAGGINNWGEIKELVANGDSNKEGLFGTSVAIFADAVVIGANGESNASTLSGHAGAAYVFERNQGGINNWGKTKRLVADDVEEFAGRVNDFGFAVDISASTVVVGAYRNNEKAELSGAAYIFERQQGGIGNWGEVRKLFAKDGSKNDLYGKSVAISANTVVIGSPQDNDGSTIDTGSIYIYEYLNFSIAAQ